MSAITAMCSYMSRSSQAVQCFRHVLRVTRCCTRTPHPEGTRPAAAWYLRFHLYFFLRSTRAKRNTKEDEVPLRKITSGPPRNSCLLQELRSDMPRKALSC